MMRLNFRNPEFFEYKFKRKPKMWSIEQLHDLWERAIDRAAIRTSERQALIQRIVTEIPPSMINRDEKVYHAFFTPIGPNHDGSLYVYDFKHYPEHDSYGYGNNRYEESKNQKEARDEKLHQVLNPIAFELGQKFYELKKLETNHHHYVKQVMWDKVEELLKIKFKNKVPPEVFTIELCGCTYYVQTDPQSRGYYNSFALKGVFNPKNIIKINDITNTKK